MYTAGQTKVHNMSVKSTCMVGGTENHNILLHFLQRGLSKQQTKDCGRYTQNTLWCIITSVPFNNKYILKFKVM